jgi:L-seryl-tRNA(Ser) seleniumtransferase
VVCFSGDKLLGGPQAGIIVGAKKLVDPIRKNPLMRTYRVEKLIYGALEATLSSYRFGRAESEIPVVRMIAMTAEDLRRRARRFARRMKARLPEGARIHLLSGESVVGGGSCPDHQLPTTLIALESSRMSPNAIESRLRTHEPPVILRMEEDRLLVDLRTVFAAQEYILMESLCKAMVGG